MLIPRSSSHARLTKMRSAIVQSCCYTAMSEESVRYLTLQYAAEMQAAGLRMPY